MAFDPIEPPDQCGMWGIYDFAREEWCLCASTTNAPAQDQRISFCGRMVVPSGVNPMSSRTLVGVPRPVPIGGDAGIVICSKCQGAVVAIASLMVLAGKHVPGSVDWPMMPKGVTSRPKSLRSP